MCISVKSQQIKITTRPLCFAEGGLYVAVGVGDSPDRGNVCGADKRVPVFGENLRLPEQTDGNIKICGFTQIKIRTIL